MLVGAVAAAVLLVTPGLVGTAAAGTMHTATCDDKQAGSCPFVASGSVGTAAASTAQPQSCVDGAQEVTRAAQRIMVPDVCKGGH